MWPFDQFGAVKARPCLGDWHGQTWSIDVVLNLTTAVENKHRSKQSVKIYTTQQSIPQVIEQKASLFMYVRNLRLEDTQRETHTFTVFQGSFFPSWGYPAKNVGINNLTGRR
jgi:hypothetical protein